MTSASERCPVCGDPLSERARFCSGCGASLSGTEPPRSGAVAAKEPHAEQRARLQRALAGDYELGHMLGRGGFAEVYAARDLRLKRDVAVKTLRYELRVADGLIERFQREAQAMAQLRHPNILPIYSVGEQEGVAFFVMPLVRGETLGQQIKREAPLPTSEVRRVLHDVASALHHAHQAGLVHRDVKPDNILLEGEERRVQVTDFGIARAAGSESTALTGTGIILGTPDYMSPEQATEGAEIDHRTDIYSLGVVGYQMLTGRLPFRASTVQGMIVKLITEDAPPITQYRPDCPPDLAEMLRRCLAKDPDARYASADALCAALEPTTPGHRARRTSSSLRALLPGGPATDTPLGRFRQQLLVFIAANALVLTVDLGTNGALDFAPVVAALSLLPIASQYARLWTAGYGWKDVFRAGTRFAGGPLAVDSGSDTAITDAFGAYAESVHRVRSERAVIAGLIANMPRSERETMPEIVGAADQVVARARSVARQLARLDRLIDRSGNRGPLATHSPAQPQGEIKARRGSLTGELRLAETVIEELRQAVERATAMGISQSRPDLESALSKADDVARSRT